MRSTAPPPAPAPRPREPSPCSWLYLPGAEPDVLPQLRLLALAALPGRPLRWRRRRFLGLGVGLEVRAVGVGPRPQLELDGHLLERQLVAERPQQVANVRVVEQLR